MGETAVIEVEDGADNIAPDVDPYGTVRLRLNRFGQVDGRIKPMSSFDQVIADQICERMAAGESLRQICRDEGMPPPSTVRMWAIKDVQGFAAQYAHAREALADAWADEIIQIADDSSNDWMERENAAGRIETVPDHENINRSRLRVDSRKWMMSKIAPKKWGDTGAGKGEGSTSFVFNFPANATPAQLQAVANLAKSGLTPKALPGVPIDVQASPAK